MALDSEQVDEGCSLMSEGTTQARKCLQGLCSAFYTVVFSVIKQGVDT